eukprot:4195990-Pleurochrysis_carterae.AAC.2
MVKRPISVLQEGNYGCDLSKRDRPLCGNSPHTPSPFVGGATEVSQLALQRGMRVLGVYASIYDVQRVVRDVHQSMPAHMRRFAGTAGQLHFLQFAQMVLPSTAREYRVLLGDESNQLSSGSTAEMLSALYVLKHTQECEGCGSACHRESSWEGCPAVQCPVCGHKFQCKVSANDGTQVASPFGAAALGKSVSGLPEWERAPLGNLLAQQVEAVHAAEAVKCRLANSLEPSGDRMKLRRAMRANLASLADDTRGSPREFSPKQLRQAFRFFNCAITRSNEALLMRRFDRLGTGAIDVTDLAEQLLPDY